MLNSFLFSILLNSIAQTFFQNSIFCLSSLNEWSKGVSKVFGKNHNPLNNISPLQRWISWWYFVASGKGKHSWQVFPIWKSQREGNLEKCINFSREDLLHSDGTKILDTTSIFIFLFYKLSKDPNVGFPCFLLCEIFSFGDATIVSDSHCTSKNHPF